jgi:hypothetical protein
MDSDQDLTRFGGYDEKKDQHGIRLALRPGKRTNRRQVLNKADKSCKLKGKGEPP